MFRDGRGFALWLSTFGDDSGIKSQQELRAKFDSAQLHASAHAPDLDARRVWIHESTVTTWEWAQRQARVEESARAEHGPTRDEQTAYTAQASTLPTEKTANDARMRAAGTATRIK